MSYPMCEYCGTADEKKFGRMVCRVCRVSTFCSEECYEDALLHAHGDECKQLAEMTPKQVEQLPEYVGILGFGKTKRKKRAVKLACDEKCGGVENPDLCKKTCVAKVRNCKKLVKTTCRQRGGTKKDKRACEKREKLKCLQVSDDEEE